MDLLEIRERAAGSTAPSRFVDDLVGRFVEQTQGISGRLDDPEHYTDSIDAAVSLVERRLPDWALTMGSEPLPWAHLIDGVDYGDPFVQPYSFTCPYGIAGAIVVALLDVLIDLEEDGNLAAAHAKHGVAS